MKWEGTEEEYCEYVEYLYLIEKAKKRDIYVILDQGMNK